MIWELTSTVPMFEQQSTSSFFITPHSTPQPTVRATDSSAPSSPQQAHRVQAAGMLW